MKFFRKLFNKTTPPKAKKVSVISERHGKKLKDDYFWLREKENPDVLDHLTRENEYTDYVMRSTENLQTILYEEMVSRMKENDSSVPEKRGEYFYYSRLEKGKQYKIYARKHLSLDSEEEILLDVNILAENYPYFSLGVFKISEDHKWIAFSSDTNGSEEYELKLLHIKDRKTLPVASKTYYDFEWANDHQTFFYTKLDQASRPYQVYRQSFGGTEELIYEETDERFFVELSKSRDDRYIFLHLRSKITTEVHLIDAFNPLVSPVSFCKRIQEIEYEIESWENCFFIVTNENAVNFKLMKTDQNKREKQYWTEYIPHREDTQILGIEAFKNHLVIYERFAGFKQLSIHSMLSGQSHIVNMPEPVYNLQLLPNPEYESTFLRFQYTSLITPWTVVDYDLNTRVWTIQKVDEIPDYKSENYISERHFAASHDGIEIPISIVYKKGLSQNSQNPLLLYGYGAYGSNTETNFSSTRLSLLDRGWIFAIAHVRGGEEMGRYWYENGKLLKKQNSFLDFISSAEYLIRQKFTSPDKLSAIGGSAGGLLMGTVLNMKPHLFHSVVAHVPFVDVINTMSDPSLPLTVTEYEEWGNPVEKEFFDYIFSYSPYENVSNQKYPHLLITAGLHDPRVSYWEPAKWAAKLREYNLSKSKILLRTHMEFGHGGASGRYDYLYEIAFDYAFFISMLDKKL